MNVRELNIQNKSINNIITNKEEKKMSRKSLLSTLTDSEVVFLYEERKKGRSYKELTKMYSSLFKPVSVGKIYRLCKLINDTEQGQERLNNINKEN